MTILSFNSRLLQLQAGESILDCLLRHGQALPYSCKAGSCQACLIQAVACEPPSSAQQGLKPALQRQGYALACQWRPHADVAVALPAPESLYVQVRIRELSALASGVCKVLLEPTDPSRMFAYRPGQYLTLINAAGVARSYSIANDFECDQAVELHIAATDHGLFTHWLFQQATVGTVLHMHGPAGECYYNPRDLDAATTPLLLAGVGTGLAPLYGLVCDALRQGHQGPIQLFHGSERQEQLYYQEPLRELSLGHPNFRYYACVRQHSDPAANANLYYYGGLESIIDDQLARTNLSQTRAFLCGSPSVVQALRRRIFLKGVRSPHIHCDLFLERAVAAA